MLKPNSINWHNWACVHEAELYMQGPISSGGIQDYKYKYKHRSVALMFGTGFAIHCSNGETWLNPMGPDVKSNTTNLGLNRHTWLIGMINKGIRANDIHSEHSVWGTNQYHVPYLFYQVLKSVTKAVCPKISHQFFYDGE